MRLPSAICAASVAFPHWIGGRDGCGVGDGLGDGADDAVGDGLGAGGARFVWVQEGRLGDPLRALVVPPELGVAEAPAGLAVREPVVATGAFEISADLGYAWDGVSVGALMAPCKCQRQERNRKSLPGRHHRRLIVRDRVWISSHALCQRIRTYPAAELQRRGTFEAIAQTPG